MIILLCRLQLTAIIWYFKLDKNRLQRIIFAMDDSGVFETKVQTRECQLDVELSFKVR